VWSANQEWETLPITSDKKGPLPIARGASGSGGPTDKWNGQYRHYERDQGRDCGAAEISALLKMLRVGLL
jgi:hypothetical protein